ncbi:TetR/AcrR family transcriptional regulator [Leptolyngbyaceae cyanobacterium CCMR0082]|uniref:TetR/AcrR family transcriptional regulator n=2 Tax=Adonisia turfae TaxID=2950184 RepID=A0A6M0SK48_9CYAN|nr:TetR/AcrR family transcriptional regulator [Adonisia turfae]NEZ55418.1 TetR/AcrR family transcriptional regulator [Adonisia turfae CCMR0081]NEZ68281.1 TetR/AcrR family transcriptional regulator [Adonisia turfae CCMR0082]
MVKYHHGDLRNTLLAIAAELLAEDGVHALSLRKMAKRAGVSHNAPYMHFADKEAVLAAIAEEGFRLLTIDVESAISQAKNSTRQKLIAASQAYVNFALNHPNHLQVMFRPVDVAKAPNLLEVSKASLNRLFELVKSGQEQGELGTADTYEMTKAIWAMVHGVSAISVAYNTTILLPERASVEDTVSTFVTFLLDGLSA